MRRLFAMGAVATVLVACGSSSHHQATPKVPKAPPSTVSGPPASRFKKVAKAPPHHLLATDWGSYCNLGFLSLSTGANPYNGTYSANGRASQFCENDALWDQVRVKLFEFWRSDGRWHEVQDSGAVQGQPVDGLVGFWIHAVAPKACDHHEWRSYYEEILSIFEDPQLATVSGFGYVHHYQIYPTGYGIKLDCLINEQVLFGGRPADVQRVP